MKEEIKRLTPTKGTLVRLFAKSGNQCAFPNCEHEIFSENILVAQVCHIEAAMKGGQRFNENLTVEQIRAENNLIILCHKHHKITDNVYEYTVKRLTEIKRIHEAQSQKSSNLSDDVYDSVIKSIQSELSYELHEINLKLDNIDNKLDFLGKTRLSRGNVPTEDDVNSYFGKFLNDDIDIAGLLLKAQPTLSDCKDVFNKDYYYDFFIYNVLFYRQALIEDKDNDFKMFNELFRFELRKFTQENYGRHKERLEIIFKDKINLYDIAFFKNDEKPRPYVSFHFWVFLNGRWVFFPKPLRAYQKIERLRNNDDLKSFASLMHKLIKCKILPKSIKDFKEEEALLAMRTVIRDLEMKE